MPPAMTTTGHWMALCSLPVAPLTTVLRLHLADGLQSKTCTGFREFVIVCLGKIFDICGVFQQLQCNGVLW